MSTCFKRELWAVGVECRRRAGQCRARVWHRKMVWLRAPPSGSAVVRFEGIFAPCMCARAGSAKCTARNRLLGTTTDGHTTATADVDHSLSRINHH